MAIVYFQELRQKLLSQPEFINKREKRGVLDGNFYIWEENYT